MLERERSRKRRLPMQGKGKMCQASSRWWVDRIFCQFLATG